MLLTNTRRGLRHFNGRSRRSGRQRTSPVKRGLARGALSEPGVDGEMPEPASGVAGCVAALATRRDVGVADDGVPGHASRAVVAAGPFDVGGHQAGLPGQGM
jgi:hypothetical protein